MKRYVKAVRKWLSRPLVMIALAVLLVGTISGVAFAMTREKPASTTVKTAAPSAKAPASKPASAKPSTPATPATPAPAAKTPVSSATPAPAVTGCNQAAKAQYDNGTYYPAINAELQRHGPAKVTPFPSTPLTPEEQAAKDAQDAANAGEGERHLATLQHLGDVRAQYMRSINCPLGL